MDTIVRLLQFLNVSTSIANTSHLEVRNSKSDHCTDFCQADPDFSTLLCSDFRKLAAKYKMKNEGLLDLINNATNRPPSEPEFPDFIETIKCIEDEVS
jgi:hypothetical protein